MEMRQQINLYHPPEEAPPPKLSFQLMLQAFSSVTAVLAMVYIIFFVMVLVQENELGELKTAGDEFRSQLLAKTTELDIMSDDTVIARELAELQGIYTNKINARQVLKDQGLDNTEGFSPYLEALARKHVPKTWFTKIVVHHGGRFIDLEGEAKEPDLVPKILAELQSEKVFDGKSFHQFDVTRHNADTVGFNIETEEGS